MRKYILLTGLIFLAAAGCESTKKSALTEKDLAKIPFAQREGLPSPTGGFVLAVNGQTVTSDEVIGPLLEHLKEFAQKTDIERFEREARPAVEQFVVSKVTNILLYQQAKKQTGENISEALDKAVDSEVRRFIVGFGGDYAKAEDALKKMGMSWADFREYQKKLILSQSYISSKLPEDKPITYGELVDYYDSVKDKFFIRPATIRFQLIDIEIDKMEVKDANESKPEKAGDLADELVKRLLAGEDFGELAKKYSNGYRKEAGGLWNAVEPDSLAEPYDILAVEAERAQPGQIVGPIGAGEHIFIMKLVEKQPKLTEPFEKVQKEVEAQLSFERRKRKFDEFGEKLVRQAVMTEKDEFVNYCLDRIYQLSNGGTK
jgi:parvulin-like peptidyl-prolyl isomerase